jgi:iron complex outermembrane receptor protein
VALQPLVVLAQTTVEPPKPAVSAPAPASTPTQPAQKQERIEVQAERNTSTERRNSTAAKIIIGREDIEQYGDTNLGDVLRRLPGITQSGPPGRGGPPRMRGMGGGYTQLLIDGQRIPPGFSLEQISPEQVELIEILRAPTAETGARAIAGTINIVLREPLRKLRNEFKAGVQEEFGRVSPNISYSRNDVLSATGTYNITASASSNKQDTETTTRTTTLVVPTGESVLDQLTHTQQNSQRNNLFVSGRLQWRLSDQGDSLSIQPFAVVNDIRTRVDQSLAQSVGATPAPYATQLAENAFSFNVMRMNAQWMKRLAPSTRFELRGGGGRFSGRGSSKQRQFDAAGNTVLTQTGTNDIRDVSWSLNPKLSHNLEGGHSLALGAEYEQADRQERPTTLLNGVPVLAGFGEELDVTTVRTAVFVQDEWDISPQWSANAGLRWEGIVTTSRNGAENLRNESSVLSPIGHLVWRFAAPRRDQLRLSLTQSYKAPNTQQLVSRPFLNTLNPVPGANTATSPDRAGNAALKPETAEGIDLAYERYLSAAGVVSVNYFRRDIHDLIRNVTVLETVPWAPVQRFVSRPRNVGDAVSQGVEFDAKFRLNELIDGAAPINLRFNMSVFRSKVEGVPGPDNTIDQQPTSTGNFGADYRLPGTQWTLGGNINWTPSYRSQVSDEQLEEIGKRRVVDLFALWTINSAAKLRFGVANVSAPDTVNTSTLIVGPQVQQQSSVVKSGLQSSIRFEMRL